MKALLVVSKALPVLLILVASAPGPVRAGAPGIPTVEAQWVVADAIEDTPGDWKPGMGFSLSGNLPVNPTFDLRADWGGRWLEGEQRMVTDPNHEPRLGGLVGETTEALRVMPATLGLVYRFEGWSQGRFWVPYAAAGIGRYDLRATFADADANERDHAFARFGWHLRGGVRLLRTSGMHISLETAMHFIDTPGKMTPMWEAALGLGALVPGRSR
jgi:hypothetical protein